METDAAAGLAGRCHKLANGFEEGGEFLVVISEAFFELEQLESELVLLAQKFAEANESADYSHAGLNRNGAVQHAGKHDGAVLGKGEGQAGRVFELAEVVTICDQMGALAARQPKHKVRGESFAIALDRLIENFRGGAVHFREI